VFTFSNKARLARFAACALAAGGLLAAASSASQAGAATASASTTARKVYTVCTEPVVSCAQREQKTKPASIVLTADGSVYVTKLRWSGWGSGKATGKGTLKQDNCKPSCAKGKISSYPATVTLTSPRSYGNNRDAYAKMTVAAPREKDKRWRHVTYSKNLVP
jgi:hypothetical protein